VKILRRVNPFPTFGICRKRVKADLEHPMLIIYTGVEILNVFAESTKNLPRKKSDYENL